MNRKIIQFPTAPKAPTASSAARGSSAELERALFLAEAEFAWETATVPQATQVSARTLY